MSHTPRHWTLEQDADGVVMLGLDKQGSSTNTLGREVMTELNERLAEIERLKPRAVVLYSAKRNGFVAGADISEFTGLSTSAAAYELIRSGQQVLDRLEALPCPTVAAIHGFALGGGLELALACRHRVAASDGSVSLGLPEVFLGIHPGFGGTVRAPRLIGAPNALDMMLTGRSFRADKALKIGLVDRLAPAAELRSAARALALEGRPAHQPPLATRLMALPIARGFVADHAEKQVRRRANKRHYPAPYAMLDLWRAHGARGAAAYEAEARSIAELFCTPTSRNLVRVFFLQDRLKALGGKAKQEFAHVHVVGAGVMGGDIAAWCAARGLTVTLQDRELKFVEPALVRAREFFAKRYSADPSKGAAAMARLSTDVAGDGVAQADVVIEAIFENAEAKRSLYASLEPRMKPGAILATNTSSIMLEELVTDLADPSRLVGLHFFNPVSKMNLVEVIRSAATSDDVMQAAQAFTRRLDKLPLPCASAPGFVVNRILMPYMTEAMFAAEEGVPLSVIDRVATDFGMPMGPVELADTVGLDVAMHVGAILSQAFGKPTPTGVVPLVEAKKLGRKTGEGYYRWIDGKAIKPDAQGAAAPADLEDRLVLQFVNEAVACLREGVVNDADLLDAGVIFGTGFAPFLGGPLNYARQRGKAACVARLNELAGKYGARFTPDEGWNSLPQLGG
ncbi:MAG: enoyl-CoA hydratase/isomerase family protein [Steroidobacteraceae bacterium]|nr:enoyl-CoA hydratase/isomerase family protein [Steroidobacteraceae bacterium]